MPLKKYPNDLKVVFKHFPLRSHKFTAQSAVAALATKKQGKNLELARKIYKNYRSFNKPKVKEPTAKIELPMKKYEQKVKKLTEKIELDLKKFEQDRKNKTFKQQIQSDRQLAHKVDVRDVPSLYINGQAVKKRSLQGLAAMVDQELKKE